MHVLALLGILALLARQHIGYKESTRSSTIDLPYSLPTGLPYTYP